MWTKLFWKDVSERAIWTFAQTLLAFLVIGTPITGIDWPIALSVSATAAVGALLKGIVAAAATKNTPTVSPASTAIDSRGIK